MSDHNTVNGRRLEIENSLEKISEEVFQRFNEVCRLTHFHILAFNEVRLQICMIFKTDKALERYKRNAKRIQQRLIDFMLVELERRGVGKKEELSVEYELDSDEARKCRRITNIPSDDDFARADKLDRYRSRNLEKVNENVDRHLKDICSLHYFELMHQGDDAFRAYVFFENEKELQEFLRGTQRIATDEVFLFFKSADEGIQASQISEGVQDIIDFVYAELERADRGKRGDIKVAFEFDSDENVNAKPQYHGDYFLRLR